MRDFSDRQKKVIKYTIIGILLAIGITISITWLVLTCLGKYNSAIDFVKSILSWLFANFGSLIVGITVKILVSKILSEKEKKEIEAIHQSYGLEKKIEPKKKKPKKDEPPTPQSYGYIS